MMLAAQDRQHQCPIGRPTGIETALLLPVSYGGVAQRPDLVIGLRRVLHRREGVKVVHVGPALDLDIAVQEGHRLGQGKEPLHAFSIAASLGAPHAEVLGVVDDGLHPQNAAGFVVGLDPVSADAVLHAIAPLT
jgi:hypothetical protein